MIKEILFVTLCLVVACQAFPGLELVPSESLNPSQSKTFKHRDVELLEPAESAQYGHGHGHGHGHGGYGHGGHGGYGHRGGYGHGGYGHGHGGRGHHHGGYGK